MSTTTALTQVTSAADRPYIPPQDGNDTIRTQRKSKLSLRKPAPYVIDVCIVSVGGLLFGFDTGTIGPVTTMPQFIETFGSFSSTIHGLIVSTILIPAALMSFFAGHLADKVGRTRAIMLGSIVFGIGAAIEAGAINLGMFIAGRILKGLGEGGFLSVVTVYACEVSPPSARGPLASISQFGTTLGLCMGFFISYGSVNIEDSIAWRLPMVIQAAFSFMLAAACPFLPESPRWLLSKGRKADADAAVARLGLSSAEFEKNLDAMPAEVGETAQQRKAKEGWLSVFHKDVRKQTALGSFMMAMAQLSGIDGVLYYAPILFQQAGLTSSQASFLASGVSALVIMVSTIPASIYADRWNRRTSAISGGFALAACMLTIGSLYAANSVHATYGAARWVVVVAIYFFAVTYSVTWAVSFRVYATEIQPERTRAPASSLSLSANWSSNFLVALTTPIFLAHSSFGAYFLFGLCSLLTAVVCLFFMPETRGQSLDAINEGSLSFNAIKHSRIVQPFEALFSRGGKGKGPVSPLASEPEHLASDDGIELGRVRSTGNDNPFVSVAVSRNSSVAQ